jgi:pimeloyl-ACP methyl ester carboxylesterase
MTSNVQEWRESIVHVASTDLTFIKGGTGRPLLVLHEELGHPGWLRWHAALAQSHTLHIPLHPGFGASPRVEWVSSVRDLAGFYARVLQDMGLSPIDVIGFSLGGWIVAEMAANCAQQFRRMVLVAPAGIRPPEGDIMDMFTVSARAYLNASVHDPAQTSEFALLYGGAPTPEQFEAWEDARAETARLAWRPYMYNPSLGPLLEGVRSLPTLVLWGRQDKIVPISAGQIYNRSITGSELAMFEGCGHRPEIEQAQGFIERVQQFLT